VIEKNGYYGLDPYNCGPTQIKCDKGLIVNQEGTILEYYHMDKYVFLYKL
jgi:hypothetical protein